MSDNPVSSSPAESRYSLELTEEGPWQHLRFMPGDLTFNIPATHCYLHVTSTPGDHPPDVSGNGEVTAQLLASDVYGVELRLPKGFDPSDLTLNTRRLTMWSDDKTPPRFKNLTINITSPGDDTGRSRGSSEQALGNDKPDIIKNCIEAASMGARDLINSVLPRDQVRVPDELSADKFALFSHGVHAEKFHVTVPGPGRVLVLTDFPKHGGTLTGSTGKIGLLLTAPPKTPEEEWDVDGGATVKVHSTSGNAVVATHGGQFVSSYRAHSESSYGWITALNQSRGKAHPGAQLWRSILGDGQAIVVVNTIEGTTDGWLSDAETQSPDHQTEADKEHYDRVKDAFRLPDPHVRQDNGVETMG